MTKYIIPYRKWRYHKDTPYLVVSIEYKRVMKIINKYKLTIINFQHTVVDKQPTRAKNWYDQVTIETE